MPKTLPFGEKRTTVRHGPELDKEPAMYYNSSMDNEYGYVYILTNPSMPEYVKIGSTKDLKQRLNQLDTTGVAMPFEPYFTVGTEKYKILEKVMHRELDKLTDTRARNNREFFKIRPEDAKDLLLNVSELLDDRETNDFGNKTESDFINADGIIKPMSSPTTFAMLGIPIGTELMPVTNAYPKVTTIDDKNLVRLENGEEKTISRAAVDATNHPRNGFQCYKYNSKTLSDIRKSMDKSYLPSHKR